MPLLIILLHTFPHSRGLLFHHLSSILFIFPVTATPALMWASVTILLSVSKADSASSFLIPAFHSFSWENNRLFLQHIHFSSTSPCNSSHIFFPGSTPDFQFTCNVRPTCNILHDPQSSFLTEPTRPQMFLCSRRFGHLH